MLSCLFIAALWSPAGWESADLLALVGDVYCIFVTFSLWYSGSGIVLDGIIS